LDHFVDVWLESVAIRLHLPDDFSVHLIILQLNDYFFLLLTGLVADAMNKYTEALTASDFSKASGNLDVLVIPVLCNLAACCIQIGNLFFTPYHYCNFRIS
jgi:hypothetical protein